MTKIEVFDHKHLWSAEEWNIKDVPGYVTRFCLECGTEMPGARREGTVKYL